MLALTSICNSQDYILHNFHFFSGLNFAEIMQRQGIYPTTVKPPYVPGFECAGIVEELGDGASGIEVSDRDFLSFQRIELC